MRILIYTVLLMIISGCCASKKHTEAVETKTAPHETEVMEISLNITNELGFDKKLYTFPRFSAEWRGGKIYVKLTYGGGCKPHDIQAFSNGKETDEGFVEIIVVDFTTDDRCRAFVNKELLINTENLDRKNVKVRVNGLEL
jgi:hypothetical protein